jgi:hypothetical protein
MELAASTNGLYPRMHYLETAKSQSQVELIMLRIFL